MGSVARPRHCSIGFAAILMKVTRGSRRPLAPVRASRDGHIQHDISPLSSRGLGRRPLTAETRVRIPVAVLSFCPQIAAFDEAKWPSGGRFGGRLQKSPSFVGALIGAQRPRISSFGAASDRPKMSPLRRHAEVIAGHREAS
jgi:hypothetical protein